MSNLAGTLSKRIRTSANWSQQQLADQLQISRNYVALIETGRKKPSVRLIDQLERLLTDVEKESTTGAVAEDQADYRKSSSSHARPQPPSSVAISRMVNPRFQHREQPTPEMCKQYFADYLDRAATQPGGIGYVWIKLQKEFPLDEFGPDPNSAE